MNRKSLFMLLSTAALLAACNVGNGSSSVPAPNSSAASSSQVSSSTSSEAVENKILVQANEAVTKIAFYDDFDTSNATLGKAITVWGDLDTIYATIELKDGYRLMINNAISSVKGTLFCSGAYGSTADGVKVYRIGAAENKTLDKSDTLVVNAKKVRAVAGKDIANATLNVITENPIEGDQVDFRLTAADGYVVTAVAVAGQTSGTKVDVSRVEDTSGLYSFFMIDEDVWISAMVEAATNVTLTVSQPVSYIYEFSLTGETSGVSITEDNGTDAFAVGENVQVTARISSYEKTVKAKLGDSDVAMEWDAANGCYAGTFVAPSVAATFTFAEGDAQEVRTLSVRFNEVTGVTVSYWEDMEDSDTRSDEVPTLYDHQGIYVKINEAAPSGKTYLVEMKADGDDEYTEVEVEEDHARAYYITIEGDTIVRISYQDAE